MKKQKKMVLSMVAFALVLVMATAISYFLLMSEMNSQKERVQFMADSLSGRIEERLLSRTYLTRMWEIFIRNNEGEITKDDFDLMAGKFYDDHEDIDRIMLFKNNRMDFMYPEGGDYFDPLEQGMLKDEILSVNGPVDIDGGKRGVILIRRMYLEDDYGADSFWGYCVITIDLNQMLNEMNLTGMEEAGIIYKLIDMSSGLILLESDEEIKNTAVETVISVPDGGSWLLTVTQKDGWVSIQELLTIIGTVLIISILFAFVVYSMLSMKARGKDLEKMSYYDNLTGLLNPRSYKEKTEELKKKGAPYCLIYMDLNDFKQVNDTYGHKAGDELLKIVSKRLSNSIREKDHAYRVGGDEFVIVVDGQHEKSFFDNIMARIKNNVARDVVIGGGKIKLKVSISCGFARYPDDGKSFEEVAQKADDSMYYNKRLMKARKLTGQSLR
ncbi:MAG: sensor domain-containing diguanylate cyclase [Butyrivibrio sp.]|nr:sensor domain-containing diguanylate cyclase [Butyrivibrio sp.]